MKLSKKDSDNVITRYTNRFTEFGYSPKTLGWDKGKQFLRFKMLTSFFNISGKSVLDIGCGFGDAINYLDKTFKNYTYEGIDLVPKLIDEAKIMHPGSKFYCSDFLKTEFRKKYDFAIGSGIFNFKLDKGNNYKYIESVIKKGFEISRKGIAFDFLSDRVDYKYEHTFHSNPENILKIAYKYSRNIILRNDYMPFEFTLIIFKNQSFRRADTIFNEYKKRTAEKVF